MVRLILVPLARSGHTDAMTVLTGAEVAAAGLTDWRLLQFALHTRFRTGDFATGLALVLRVGTIAERRHHHPDVALRYAHVDLRLSTHDEGGVTARDLDLAREISEVAAELGVPADPTSVQVVEIGLDTSDRGKVSPFWHAVLGVPAPGGDAAGGTLEVADSSCAIPALWFQDSASEAPDRQRFHLDVIVPEDVARQRVEEALAAGGQLVTDEWAPSFTVVADPQGNRACVCTWHDPDD